MRSTNDVGYSKLITGGVLLHLIDVLGVSECASEPALLDLLIVLTYPRCQIKWGH